MFRTLIVNTVISALAYLAISVVGLVVVPVLLGAYGLVVFGLIALARLWMPTGALGLLDLGIGETATQTIARARASAEWKWAGDQLAGLILIALCVGVSTGALLHFGAETLSSLLRVPSAEVENFSRILRITAWLLPLLFVGLVAEGIVKGFEDYRTVRSIEVLASLLYGAGAVGVALAGGAYPLVAYAALGANVVRAIAALIAAALRSREGPLNLLRRPEASGFRECWSRTRLMAANRLLSTLQVQAAPPLVGVFVGPSGVAVYDILVRLPRFAKSVLGLVNSAVLPFAARLDAGARHDDLRRLGAAGLPVVAAVTMPPLFAAAVFSEPLLALWLGPELSAYWAWQSAMFAVPLLTVLVGFGVTALLGRPVVLKRLNRYLAMQFGVQMLISLVLVGSLAERAFIAGQVAAAAITFYWQMRLIFRNQSLGAAEAKRLVIIAVVGVALGAVGLSCAGWVDDLAGLVAGAGVFVIVYWVSLALLLFDRDQRRVFINRALCRRR